MTTSDRHSHRRIIFGRGPLYPVAEVLRTPCAHLSYDIRFPRHSEPACYQRSWELQSIFYA